MGKLGDLMIFDKITDSKNKNAQQMLRETDFNTSFRLFSAAGSDASG